MTQWFGDSSRDFPSKDLDSSPECRRSHANLSGPFENGLGLTVVGNPNVGTSVKGLFGSCRPTTVIRRVVSIIISSVKRQPRESERFVISNEGGCIAPSLANTNAASSVSIIGRVVRIVATVHQSKPCVVETMASETVSPRGLRGLFFGKTAARCRRAVSEAITVGGDLVSAVALAKPIHVASSAANAFLLKCNQPPKALVSNVFSHTHGHLFDLVDYATTTV